MCIRDRAYNQFAGLTRVYYDDPLGLVNAAAIVTTSTNGDVLIGGSFDEVGGGSYNANIRPTDDSNSENGLFRIRSGVRNHSNIAGLVGGATPSRLKTVGEISKMEGDAGNGRLEKKIPWVSLGSDAQ